MFALYVLYAFEGLFVLGFVLLIIWIAGKAIFYPMKTIYYVNQWGNPRTKRVPDTDYHYKPEELWQEPLHWKAWKKTGTNQEYKNEGQRDN